MATLTADEALQNLTAGQVIIDVRAPVEFAAGAIPQSINQPILSDEQRHLVGTCYKETGSEAAIRLGHELVSGVDRECKINLWCEQIRAAPDSILTCFRGGLRSQTAQLWLQERGIAVQRLVGGYKEMRARFLKINDETPALLKMFNLCGHTGSGKTQVLRALPPEFVLDLEDLAQHRGSAFGAIAAEQPSQASFENSIALQLFRLGRSSHRSVVIEDESRFVGFRLLPLEIFNEMQSSAAILIEEPLENRIDRIFEIYVRETPIGRRETEQNRTEALAQFDSYLKSTQVLARRLGGLRTAEVTHWLEQGRRAYLLGEDSAVNREWISRLLQWYYDPLYERHWQKRGKEPLMSGTAQEVLQFLQGQLGSHDSPYELKI